MTEASAPLPLPKQEKVLVYLPPELKKMLSELKERLGLDTSSIIRIGILRTYDELIDALNRHK